MSSEVKKHNPPRPDYLKGRGNAPESNHPRPKYLAKRESRYIKKEEKK